MAKAKPTTCLFDQDWADNVTGTLDDLYELLEDVYAQVQDCTKASGNTPITDELAKALTLNNAIARRIDRKVPNTRKRK